MDGTLSALYKQEAMLMESHDVIEQYLAAIKTLRAAFGDMSRELLPARPVAGMWSSQEVLCRLVDTDLTIALRIRATLTRDCSRLQTATREDMTTGLAVDARDAAEELTLFQTIRCETARIVRALLPNALDRQAVLVAADGAETTRTVQQFLTGITKHVAHHSAFVYEKRRSLVMAPPHLPAKDNRGSWPNVSGDFRVPHTDFESSGKLESWPKRDVTKYANVFIDDPHRF